MDNKTENYYSILGCNETAPLEEIKKCYYEKALVYHPDKSISNNHGTNFDKINKAWKTLSDEKSRQQYNAKLNEERFASQSIVFEVLSRSELAREQPNTVTKMCRCGGQYVIDAGDIPRQEDCDILVECDTCSLVIVVR